MKNYLSYNNNASYLTRSKVFVDNDQDELSNSSNNSQILNIIRSIVDELYQISNREILSRNESKDKRVRFTLEQQTDKIESVILNETSTKYQPVLSESSTVCCLMKGRSKVDCSVSKNDYPSLQCECATQTMDVTVVPEDNHSLMSLLTASNDRHRSRSNIALSTISIYSKSTIIRHPSLLSISNHSLYSCENNNIVPSLTTDHQLIIPSKPKHYDICQEQTLENYDTFINLKSSNASTKLNDHNSLSKSNNTLSDENITETDIKFCTCSKRKLSDNHFSMNKFTFTDQGKLLEELHSSKRSLQSIYNDNLFYIHDLVLVFLRNIPQFYQILVKHYYLSKKQATLYVKIMQKWWEKHQKEFIDINEKLSKSNIIK